MVVKLELGEGKATAEREIEGARETWETSLPALLSAQKGLNEPRYASLKGIMAAKRKPLESWALPDIGLSADDIHGAALTVVTAVRPPEAKAPTERIENLAATEAAAKIADWLAARKLI
jgi:electron transfer flavoprotein beta subunit